MPEDSGSESLAARLDGYDTPAAAATGEIRVQRSRFLCKIAPVVSAGDAKAEVADMARQYHDARHLCYAWRLGPPEAIREFRQDAGEPAGTAGEPILGALRQAGLTDCVAMVARYFGGVKLGTGGLARAYGEAVASALARVSVSRVLLGFEIDLNFAYTHEKILARLLAECQGCRLAQNYSESVSWKIWLPRLHRESFVSRVTDATAGERAITGITPAVRRV